MQGSGTISAIIPLSVNPREKNMCFLFYLSNLWKLQKKFTHFLHLDPNICGLNSFGLFFSGNFICQDGRGVNNILINCANFLDQVWCSHQPIEKEYQLEVERCQTIPSCPISWHLLHPLYLVWIVTQDKWYNMVPRGQKFPVQCLKILIFHTSVSFMGVKISKSGTNFTIW